MRRKVILTIFKMIFKVKRIVGNLFSVKRLDYMKVPLFIYVDNIREYRTRANSCKKEPETIEWIESHPQESIFYDIGANIGAYSLVAAANEKKVFAFEPAYQNFCTLNRNVSLNKFDKKISCFPIAMSTETKLGTFKYSETTSGTNRGFYNEDAKFHIDFDTFEAEKTAIIFSLDDFIDCFKLPYPNMIKIDVDGGEEDIIMGAKKTLGNKALKTVLIEIDDLLNSSSKIIAVMKENGFVLESKHLRARSTENYIFVKKTTD